MRRKNTSKGFTLVELLIVLAIIGILAAVLTPQFLNARKVAVDKAALGFGHNMFTVLQAHIAEGNDWTPLACSDEALPKQGNSFVIGNYSVPIPRGGFNLVNCRLADDHVLVEYTGGIDPPPSESLNDGIQRVTVGKEQQQ